MTTKNRLPTCAMVKKLLKELGEGHRYLSDSLEYTSLMNKMNELEEAFHNTPKYLKLAERARELSKKSQADRNRRRTLVERVRHQFLANGVTQEVMKSLDDLLRELNHAQDT